MKLAGQGGDPVVQLQTNFGGGKTHSMLAPRQYRLAKEDFEYFMCLLDPAIAHYRETGPTQIIV